MRRPRPLRPRARARYSRILLAALLGLILAAAVEAADSQAAEPQGPDRPLPGSAAPVDTGAPTTSFFTSPPLPDGDDGWFRSPVLITLTAQDPEGSPVITYYSWGVDPPTGIYAGSFALPTGTSTLYYRSVDAAGNEEPVKSQVFLLDTAVTPPALLEPLGSEQEPAIVRGSVGLEASANDAGSGVAYVAFFRFGGGEGEWDPVGAQIGPNLTVPAPGRSYQTAWDTFTVKDGPHRLQAQVRDRAGNAAFSTEQYVLVDNTSPLARLSSPPASAAISGREYAVAGEVFDANLAGWSLEWRSLPDGAWASLADGDAAASGTLASLDTTAYPDGQYELRLRAMDAAGNDSQVTHSSISVDNTPPVLLSAASGGPDIVDVLFSETLDPAGVASEVFSITGLDVVGAALQLDGRTVSLTTSPQEEGTSYPLRLGGGLLDLAGNQVESGSADFAGSAIDTVPPRPPLSLQATAGNGRNLIVWAPGAEPDLAGYNVYRDTQAQGAFAARANEELVSDASEFRDAGYGEEGLYWYAVSAVDRAGNESPRSVAVPADQVDLSALVGAAGAELSSSTGELRLSIPAQAVSAEQTIEATEQPQPADESGFVFASKAYDLRPNGLAFAAEVAVTMAVDQAGAAGQEGDLRLVYLSDSGWRQVEGGSSLDAESGTITGRVNHFTRFACALVDSTRPSVRSIEPSPGTQDAPVTSYVTVVFDEPMDPESLTPENLLVTDEGQPIELEPLAFSADLRTVYLYPAAALDVSKSYAVLVRGGAVRDAAGNGMSGDVSSTFTTAAGGITPHDAYLSAPEMCSTCHDTEGGREPGLETLPAEKQVCYTCHDGTGSSYNVRTADNDATPAHDFGEAVEGSSDKISFHPVPQASPLGTGVTMLCSHCHNAHPREGQGPRMLAVKKLDPSFTGAFGPKTGNDFCWTCHEGTAPAAAAYLGPVSWNASTGFDHKRFYPAPGSSHNSATGPGFAAEAMQVPTVENVACKACHSEHGSANSKLVAERVNGIDVSFSTANDAAYDATYNGLCAACHEAPGVGGFAWPGARIYAASGHGASVATKALTYSPPVPAAPQNLRTGVCKQCHEPHGAGDDNGVFPNLTRLFEQSLCLACHGATGNPEGARNMQAVFSRTSRHDLDLSASNARKHELQTEQAGGLNPNPGLAGANRHVECADCHNTHFATGPEQGDSALHARGSNQVSGALLGVWGVEPDAGGAWSASSTWDWSQSRVFPAAREYQICLKCHSAAAFGSSPPGRPQQTLPGEDFWNADTYTDQATEFNPANASYHAVWGSSKASGFGTYRNGWTSDSQMYCSDCHRSSIPGDPSGPHGSTTPFLLGGNAAPGASRYVKGVTTSYVTNAERDADATFCYECHDPGFANTGFSTVEGLNLHTARHETDSCTTCHAAVPHGWQREHLLVTRSDPAPYNDHGAAFGIPDSATFSPSGEWTEPSCHNEENTGCHTL